MLKNSILSLLKKLTGLALINPENWRVKHEFERLNLPPKLLQVIRKNTMVNESRLVNLQEVIRYVASANLPGAYVECGVWKGGSVAFAAHQFLSNKHQAPLHLFDAFDDICQPDAAVDGQRAVHDVGGNTNAAGQLTPVKGVYDKLGGPGEEQKVVELIATQVGYPKEKIHIHKGWFQDTLPVDSAQVGEIAVLRLDGDWYSSTKVCLDYLFNQVVSGGVIIVDDYGCYEGCKKAVDEFLQAQNLTPFLIKVDDECVYWIKQGRNV
ncbi:hypothetical protein MASR2M44_24410 [Bacteroidota bacterium]